MRRPSLGRFALIAVRCARIVAEDLRDSAVVRNPTMADCRSANSSRTRNHRRPAVAEDRRDSAVVRNLRAARGRGRINPWPDSASVIRHTKSKLLARPFVGFVVHGRNQPEGPIDKRMGITRGKSLCHAVTNSMTLCHAINLTRIARRERVKAAPGGCPTMSVIAERDSAVDPGIHCRLQFPRAALS